MNRYRPARRCAPRLRLFVLGIAGFAAAALAQINPAAKESEEVGVTATSATSIEVATIKIHDPNSSYNNFRFSRDRVSFDKQTVSRLMTFAYAINKAQIVGAPDWIWKTEFDIDGKTTADADPSVPEQQRMMRQLLADRFGLRFHQEKRELPVYALQVAKGGPRLTPAANAGAQPLERSNGHGYQTTQIYTSNAISDFVVVMQFFVDRPIIDQTDLQGRYDFQLSYTYGDSPNPDPDAPPALFTAVQEQLGLKLQPTKAATEVLVVESIEQPTPN